MQNCEPDLLRIAIQTNTVKMGNSKVCLQISIFRHMNRKCSVTASLTVAQQLVFQDAELFEVAMGTAIRTLLLLVNCLVTQFAELFMMSVIFNFMHLFIGPSSRNLLALWMLVQSLRMMDVLYGNIWSRSIVILCIPILKRRFYDSTSCRLKKDNIYIITIHVNYKR